MGNALMRPVLTIVLSLLVAIAANNSASAQGMLDMVDLSTPAYTKAETSRTDVSGANLDGPNLASADVTSAILSELKSLEKTPDLDTIKYLERAQR